MSTHNRCSCGERHRRFRHPSGATVTGCPVCMSKPEAAEALAALIEAARKQFGATPEPEGGSRE